MRFTVRLVLLGIILQATFKLGSSGVQHLTFADQRCFPEGFVYELEERQLVRLIVIPYLSISTLEDLSRLDIIRDNNRRYSDFLSCIWKDRGFQNWDGSIHFQKIEVALAEAIAKEVGETGPGINLSKIKAKEIVSQCKRLGGITHGQKVVFVRNCVLTLIKKFEEFQS